MAIMCTIEHFPVLMCVMSNSIMTCPHTFHPADAENMKSTNSGLKLLNQDEIRS